MTGWDKVSHSRVRPLGVEQRRSKKMTIVTVKGGFKIQRNAVEQAMPAENSFTTILYRSSVVKSENISAIVKENPCLNSCLG